VDALEWPAQCRGPLAQRVLALGVRISAIADARFSVIVDGVSA
jgi:hypothetical protein